MNILLVDTNNSTFKDFTPLALLRLAALYKGENIQLIKAGERAKTNPDLIFFSLIFLFNMKKDIEWVLTYKKQYPNAKVKIGGLAPTLKPDLYRKYLCEDEIFLGRDLELEKLSPDFSITNKDYSYGFTSRGCHNKCDWCVVPRLEGYHKIVDNWQSQIDITKKVFYCFDNNIFACGYKHLDDVLTYCDEYKIKVDFNQGLDAELFYKNEKIREVILKHKNSYKFVRYAWDSHRVDEAIKFVVRFYNENKIKSSDRGMIYAIYDDKNNSPKDFFERIKIVFNSEDRWVIKPMRFKGIESNHYDRNWGSIGDLISTMVSFSPVGLIENNRYCRLLLNHDFDEVLKRISICYDYKRTHKIHSTDGFIKYYEDYSK